MRLSNEQIKNILDCVHQNLSSESQVWLFGSRCEDLAKGGDIDLYIELPKTTDLFMKKIKLRLALEDLLGEQKIDLLCHQINTPFLPIHKMAKEKGSLLGCIDNSAPNV